MKIACIDQKAADRIALQELIQSAFNDCRDSAGYLPIASTYTAVKEDILHGSKPDIVLLGSKLNTEECFFLCKDLHRVYPDLPILLFLDHAHYSVRTLRRFQPYTTDIFLAGEPSARLIHKLIELLSESRRVLAGSLLSLVGVKGGVGVTSLTTGLAHAAHNDGKTSCVVDLSRRSVLARYLGADRLYSQELSLILTAQMSVDAESTSRCVVKTPCGIDILIPPHGGTDIQELWLRSPDSFELTLGVIEHLRELYDVVIVDQASAQGVLPFSVQCRADRRILVTTNEPAAVSLLPSQLEEVLSMPGAQPVTICLNQLYQRSLNREDVLDFLYTMPSFDENLVRLLEIPSDNRGREWAGAGNSFYTESSARARSALELMFRAMMPQTDSTISKNETYISNTTNFLSKLFTRKKEPMRLLLPASTGAADEDLFDSPVLVDALPQRTS